MTTATPSYLDNFFSVDINLGGARISKGNGLNFDSTQFAASLNTNTQQVDISLTSAGSASSYIKASGGALSVARYDLDPASGAGLTTFSVLNATGSASVLSVNASTGQTSINNGALLLSGAAANTYIVRGASLTLAGAASAPGTVASAGQVVMYSETRTRLTTGSSNVPLDITDNGTTVALTFGANLLAISYQPGTPGQEKIGMFGATPVVRQTVAGDTHGTLADLQGVMRSLLAALNSATGIGALSDTTT